MVYNSNGGLKIMNIWKIGCRWSYEGNPETSLFSLFLKNNIVFCGEKGNILLKKVHKGDYFAIADGITVKAVAEAISEPADLETLIGTKTFECSEYEFFNYSKCKNYAKGCKVIIKELEKTQYFDYSRGAFFSANKYRKKIKDLYDSGNKLYSLSDEIKLNAELHRLFADWKKHLEGLKLYKDYTAQNFINDGFYPFYTRQKKKILFIGREALGIDGKESYIDVLIKAYKNNKVGKKHINRHQFHNLMFKITYSLCNSCFDWKKITAPNKLTKQFGTPDGISFAFMNISKFSNEGKWQKNTALMNSFTKNAEDFIEREIKILNPDLVITMNLGDDNLKLCGKLKKIQENSSRNIGLFELDLGDRVIKLADTWHFSAPGKSPEKDIWKPLLKSLELVQNF